MSAVLTGETLRRLRLASGYTQIQAARIMGISVFTLCFCERGKRPVSPRTQALFLRRIVDDPLRVPPLNVKTGRPKKTL